MKIIPIELAEHYEQETTTIASCMKITRTDGLMVGFTSVDRRLRIEGLDYQLGVDVSSIVSSAGLNVDNMEMTIVPDGEVVKRLDIISGRWDKAAFEIFEVNYEDTGAGTNPIKSGTLGEVELNRGKFTVELRSLKQALQQPVGEVTSKTCRYRLGDARCRVDLETFTHDAVVTESVDNQTIASDDLTQDDDYFTEGYVLFMSGQNDGLSYKCKSFSSGQITLSLPMEFPCGEGDEFIAVAGCQKRHLLDCRDKFTNIPNFGGEPHLAGIDALTRNPVKAV